MATTLVQQTTGTATGTVCNVSLNGVGAGHALIVVIRSITGNVTLTTGDGNGSGNVYTAGPTHVFTNFDGTHDGVVQVDYCTNSASGTITVSVTTSGSVTLFVELYEVSGLPSPFQVTSGLLAELSSVTSHTACSPALAVPTGSNFVAVGGLIDVTVGGVTGGTSYTNNSWGSHNYSNYATALSGGTTNGPSSSTGSAKFFSILANFGPAPPIPQNAFLFFLDDWI
jgi:hypothetical protein